jgi:uncharacterized protein YbaR (Trm112 family)
MKQFLLPHLICPACLPAERALEVSAKRFAHDDIIAGELSCRKCRKRFPIKDGIAYLLPDPEGYSVGGQMKYDENEMVNRYLWSHYADLAGDVEGTSAHKEWAALLAEGSAFAFDAGCAVGRLTFEMAARSSWAVGCDLSVNFIRTARRLAQERSCTFSLPLEGALRETFQCQLPSQWPSDNLEFIVANAMAVPFAKGTFQQASSLNLLDRVSYPLAHLYEMNRVLRTASASFLFADPFSWSTSSTPEERWLGGLVQGEYAGRGIDNVRRLLTAQKSLLAPAWQVDCEGSVTWEMRTHSNHRELIRSQYILAQR